MSVGSMIHSYFIYGIWTEESRLPPTIPSKEIFLESLHFFREGDIDISFPETHPNDTKIILMQNT